MSKRTVCLIRPPMCFSKSSYSSPVTPPLALAYLSAVLKQKGHDVTCIDGVGEAPDRLTEVPEWDCLQRGISLDEIVAKIPKDIQFIGLSCMFSQEWLHTRTLIRKIRESFQDAILIVGGEHVTALPEFILETCPEVDVCALGEGEHVLLDIIKQFPEEKSEIPGIVYREGSEIVRSEKRKRIADVSELPLPDWDAVPIEKYHEFKACNGIYAGISMPILATRGCPFQCTFCSNPTMWGNRYFMRDPAQVVDEIEGYVEKYGAESIEFYDLTAIIKKQWILDFCKLYKERKLKVTWTLPSGTRSEALDAEVLQNLQETNCKYLVYAAESGSPTTLKKIKKKIKLEKMFDSIRNAKRLGLVLRCNLIIGLPTERFRDVLQTIWFQWRLAILGVDDTPLYMFSPYPGSELFRQLQEDGTIEELSDDYFKSLLQQIDLKRCKSYNKQVANWQLNILRIVGMSVAYMCSYVFHPSRIVRTFKNIFVSGESSTVFEQRVIEMRRNKKNKAEEAKKTKAARAAI